MIALAGDLIFVITARDTDAIVKKVNIGLNRISTSMEIHETENRCVEMGGYCIKRITEQNRNYGN